MLFLLIVLINLFIAFYFVLVNNYILYLSKTIEKHDLIIEFNILFFSAAVILQPILIYIRKILGKKRIIIISLSSFIVAIILLVYGIMNKNFEAIYLGALAEGAAFSVLFPLLSSMLTALDRKNSGKNLNNVEIIWSLVTILIPVIILYIDLDMFIIISFITIIALLAILILVYKYVDDDSLRTYRFTKSDIRRISLIVLAIASFIYFILNLNIYIFAAILLVLLIYVIKNRKTFDRLTVILNNKSNLLLGLSIFSVLGFYIPINLSGWIYINIIGLDSSEMFTIITITSLLSILSLFLSGRLMDEQEHNRLLGIGFVLTTVSSILAFLGAYILAIAILIIAVNMFGPIYIRKLLLDVDDENTRENLSNTYLLIIRVATLVSIKIGYVVLQYIGLTGMFLLIMLVNIIYYRIFSNIIRVQRLSISQI